MDDLDLPRPPSPMGTEFPANDDEMSETVNQHREILLEIKNMSEECKDSAAAVQQTLNVQIELIKQAMKGFVPCKEQDDKITVKTKRSARKAVRDMMKHNRTQQRIMHVLQSKFVRVARTSATLRRSLLEDLNNGVVPPAWWIRHGVIGLSKPDLCSSCGQAITSIHVKPKLPTVADALAKGKLY